MSHAEPTAGDGAAVGAVEGGDEGRLRRVHPVTPLLRGGIVLGAIVVYVGRQLAEGGAVDVPWWVGVLVVVGAVVWGGWSWWLTRFRVGDQVLRVDSGIVFRSSRRIRLDRVQAVQVQQPLLARVFGMAQVEVETAGSGTEATLAFLTVGQARDLRAELLRRAAAAGAGALAGGPEVPAGPLEVLHVAQPGRLLAAQVLRTGVALSALGGLVAIVFSASAWGGGAAAVFVPTALGLGGAIAKGFVASYGFTLTDGPEGLAARSGLLDVRTRSVPVDRVQGVVVLEPLVWRWLGWCEVRLTVAGVGASDDEADVTTVLVPVAPRDQAVATSVRALASGPLRRALDPGGVPLTPAPRRARWVDPVGAAVLALGVGDDIVVTRRGVLTRRTDVVPRHKVQSAALRQGPLQRRLGLATLDLHLPAGPVDAQARHRDPADLWAHALTVARPHLRPVTEPSRGDVPTGVMASEASGVRGGDAGCEG